MLGACIGLSALTGCYDSDYDRHYNDYKSGEYGSNTFDYPNKETEDRVHAECDGKTLKVKAIKNESFIIDNDKEKEYYTDPACKDGELTRKDDIEKQFEEAANELDWGPGPTLPREPQVEVE